MGGQFALQIPEPAHALNGLAWRTGSDPREAAATVLRLLGLTEADRRVFLSYARADGSALAHQLRYALLDAGWDVFLDQFSIPPAAEFQQKLFRDLSDKAFVLLLETPAAFGRHYVDQEVAFAHNHRLGLLALTAPGVPTSRRFPSVQEDFRQPLEPADVVGAASKQRLKVRVLADLLRQMDERHAAAYQQRREELMQSTEQEMRRSGLDVVPIGHWSLLGQGRDGDEIALVTARAPQPKDLLDVEHMCRRAGRQNRACRGWVVHPLEDVDAERARLVRWLSGRRRTTSTPVLELADRLRL